MSGDEAWWADQNVKWAERHRKEMTRSFWSLLAALLLWLLFLAALTFGHWSWPGLAVAGWATLYAALSLTLTGTSRRALRTIAEHYESAPE